MKTHSQHPETASHTIQGKNRASKQASMESVLQKYAQSVESGELRVESVQRQADNELDDELLQGKFENNNGRMENGVKTKGAFSPVVQMWDGEDISREYTNSIYQCTETQDTTIYQLYDQDDQIRYVGKTTQPLEYRLAQHRTADPTHRQNLEIEAIESGDWTPFEAATYEQFYLDEAYRIMSDYDEGLLNVNEALDLNKWKYFRYPEHDVNRNQANQLTEDYF